MTIKEIIDELQERLELAQEDAKESHKIDANCYGAGFDSGYVDAMAFCLGMLKEELDDCWRLRRYPNPYAWTTAATRHR